MQDLIHARADCGLHGLFYLGLGGGRHELELWLPDLLAHALLHPDDVLDTGVGEAQCFEHDVFGHLVGAGFDHQDSVFGACDA